MKITLGVVVFGTKYLDVMLESLINQTDSDFDIILRDQEEDTYSAYEYISKNYPKIKIKKGKNLFHSGGHDHLALECSGDYYIIGSQDMYYPSNFIENLKKQLQKNKKYQVFAPCIKRFDYPHGLTEYIDSYGIKVDRLLRFKSLGFGEKFNNFKPPMFADGPDGALMIFKKSAIAKITEKNGMFLDPEIHYKNDCELALRLKKMNLRCKILPNLFVFHDRQAVSFKKKSYNLVKSSFIGEGIILHKHLKWNFEYFNPIFTSIYHLLKRIYLIVKYPSLWKNL